MEKEKKNGTKFGKILAFIIVLAILATVTTIGVYSYLKYTNARDTVATATYVGMFEDGTYYIPKARKDIRFQIEKNDTNTYELTDKSGNIIESQIVQKDGKNYIEALQEYQEGDSYLLELTDNNFSEAILKRAKKVEFKIESYNKSQYQFADSVKKIEQRLDIKTEGENQTLEVNDLEISPNDILLANDFAYKVDKIENGVANLSTPVPAEVFKSFELHEERMMDFSNMTLNPELQDQIKISVEKSPIYQMLVNECKAANIENKAEVKGTDDGLKAEIVLTIKADGEEYLGIKALANHDLTLKFIIELTCKTNDDIIKGSAINLDLAMKEKFDFDISLQSNGTVIKGIGELSEDEYCKTIQDIVAKLEQAKPDKKSDSVWIGVAKIPTEIPFVYMKADVFLQRALELQVNFHYNQTVEASQNLGFILDTSGLYPYFLVNMPETKYETEAVGKAYAELGIGFDVGVEILGSEVMIRTEGGFYGEVFSGMNIEYNSTNKHINENFLGKVEIGIYFRNKITATLDLLFYKKPWEKSIVDEKIPILKIGTDTITTAIESKEKTVPIGSSNNVTLPTIVKKIKNLSSGKTDEEVCNDYLILLVTDDKGNKLSLASNMMVKLKQNADTELTITYQENDRVYKTTVKAVKEQTHTTSNHIGSSSNQSGVNTSSAVSVYKDFLKNKKYRAHIKDAICWNQSKEEYCILDVNQDGIEELFIEAPDDEFSDTLMYTYNPTKKQIILIKDIYGYWKVRYSKKDKEICYAPVRPNMTTGVYEFYQLKNEKLVGSKTVGHDLGKSFVFTNGKEDWSLTQEQESAYFKELITLEYTPVSNIK